MPVVEKLRNWVFHQVHSKNLVYNTCWEDPRCDRNLLKLDNDSEVVMITSAGCNALAYLLDSPKNIHCVDVNGRQNALLQLKLSLFRNADYETLFQFFGKGLHKEYERIYQQSLRRELEVDAQNFWDKHLKYFAPKGIRKNFYHYGTTGTFAWLLQGYLKSRKKLYNKAQSLLEASSLEEQRQIYYSIEPKIINKTLETVVNRHFTMCLLGVPRSQQELFFNEYYRGALGFIQECLRKVFTQLPIEDNYFYRVYISGEYTETCCPDYLLAENFSQIRALEERIETYTSTLSQFLNSHPGKYSHFVLLDHMDWLASNDAQALEEEWRLILSNSRPGTKILFRSAAAAVDFLPDFAKNSLTFHTQEAEIQHQLDRVGTYASTYLATVK